VTVTQHRDDPTLDELHAGFDLGLVAVIPNSG